MYKIKRNTTTHKKRILWAIARCVVGLAGAAFFIYFLILSIRQFNDLTLIKTLIDRGQIAEYGYESIAQERRVIVSYLSNITKKRGAFPGEASTEYDTVDLLEVYKAQSITDTYFGAVISSLPSSQVGPGSPLKKFYDSLTNLRVGAITATIPLDQVVNTYAKGLHESWLVWAAQMHTPNAKLNILLANDCYLHAYFESFRLDRDYTSTILQTLGNKNNNITEAQVSQILTRLGGIMYHRDIFYDLYRLEAVPQQIQFLETIITSPQFVTVNTTFYDYHTAVVTALYSTFSDGSLQGLPTIGDWLNTSNTLLRLYKGLDVIDVEPLQDSIVNAVSDEITAQLTAAAIGTVLEVFAAVSIIWLAYPIVRLLWRLSSSQSLSQTRKDTSTKTANTKTIQKDPEDGQDPESEDEEGADS